eukprot:TRINITY_DN3339_c0_g1_i2.p1 TRINITY_DN3339_c0_g1~~TRINITY_DN3339_c0_g1_i2.p1  ORF type:complete len:104 (-),score=13.45 TRINITY_DN3339_c0_g1_i2:28-339(-)
MAEADLESLLALLEDRRAYEPLLPESLLDHYLQQAGLDTTDVKVKRLISLATEKFLHDVMHRAHDYVTHVAAESSDNGKTELTAEALSAALLEHGIRVPRSAQ